MTPEELRAKRERQARWWFGHYRKRYYPALKRIPLEVGAGNLNCAEWGQTYFEGEEPVLVRIAEASWTKAETQHFAFMKSVLLHELIHCALGPKPNCKNKNDQEWNSEVLRLSKLGALLETI